MAHQQAQPRLGPISPFFIVRDVPQAMKFYQRLGFELRHLATEEDPFFAIVGRGPAQLFLKAIDESVVAQPNPSRHEGAPWDAFAYADDPDSLADEFALNEVVFHKTLANFEQHGLRGFEVRDIDGYVLFFGCPMSPS